MKDSKNAEIAKHVKNAYIQKNSKDVKNLMVYRKCRDVKIEKHAREATIVKDEKDAQKRGGEFKSVKMCRLAPYSCVWADPWIRKPVHL